MKRPEFALCPIVRLNFEQFAVQDGKIGSLSWRLLLLLFGTKSLTMSSFPPPNWIGTGRALVPLSLTGPAADAWLGAKEVQ